MNRLILMAIAVLLGMADVNAQKTVEWEHPATAYGTDYGDGYFNLAIDVEKVELGATETNLHVVFHRRPDDGGSFTIAGSSYLVADGKRYSIVSADGMELDKSTMTNQDGKKEVVLHFQPLPQDIRSLDFMEGEGKGAFQIKGIMPVEERWKQLLPSYWADEKTGNWEIAFLEDCAIYDCRFWEYKQCRINAKTGEADIIMSNGEEELQVKVGKDKKGRRSIRIGQQKKAYTMITSRFMPDYPVADNRTAFADNGYKMDTVTVAGWIKDMPQRYRSEKTFQFSCYDLFTGAYVPVFADLDEDGRFLVKIPVVNSTEFTCDWSRCFIRTMFEPGKTYFLLYDFKEGRRYFMGDDCRLQNELFRFPLSWNCMRMEKGGDMDKYIADVDKLLKEEEARIDALSKEHPSLSARFCKYSKENALWQQAREFGQSRFSCPDFRLTDNGRKFAHDAFWTKLDVPLTLHREITGFLVDYLGDCLKGDRRQFIWNTLEHMEEYAENEEQLAFIRYWKACVEETQAIREAATSEAEKKRIDDEWARKHAEDLKKKDSIVTGEKTVRLMYDHAAINDMIDSRHKLDSMKASPIVRDFYLTRTICGMMDHNARMFGQAVMDTLKALVDLPVCIACVEEMNNHYIALANREFDKLSLKSSQHLQGVTEGEELLKKLLEPFKGKIVLLDVWGTWCSPCRQALSHSQDEYDRLEKYDIAYVYLANNSPQDAWENVIKEYNVSGKNVAHYNLPKEQQAAIERYLKVTAYPTYKLFDREGHMLELNVNAQNLESLEAVIKQLSGQ